MVPSIVKIVDHSLQNSLNKCGSYNDDLVKYIQVGLCAYVKENASFHYFWCFRAMVHLSRHEAEVGIFAPNIEQMHAIDHTKGEPMEVNRWAHQIINKSL